MNAEQFLAKKINDWFSGILIKMKIALLLGLVLVIEQALTEGHSSDIVGKLVVGYQGWFGAPNDG